MENFKAPEPAEAKLHFLDYWRILRIRKTVIIAVFLLVVITTTVVTYLLPETFMSYTRIKVEKDGADIPLLGQTMPAGPPDPFFLQTEFEVIQSKTNLYRVIDELELNKEWSQEYLRQGVLKTQETFEILKDKIDVRQYRNTTMIEIRVYSRNKAEAARIANKIAEVYRESRLSERERMSERGIERVQDSLKEQQVKVEELQNTLDALKEKYRITDLMVDSWSVGTLEADAVRRTDTARTDVNRNVARVDSTLGYLKKLDRDGLRNVLPSLFRDDVLLIDALQKESEAQARLVQLLNNYSEDHPDVKGVQMLLAKLNRNIEGRISGIIEGLQAQSEAYRNELAQLDDMVKKATDEDLRRAKEYREYWLKKRKLENEKIMLDVLARKVAQETFDKQISRQSLVVITDFAEEGLKPVKPNIPLNIAFGVVVGLIRHYRRPA